MDVSTDILTKVADYVEATMPRLAKQAELDQKVSEAAPDVVDTLIKKGFVDADKRAAALKAVHDPLKVLASLKKTAEAVELRKKDSAPAPMGEAAEIKEAGTGRDRETGESQALKEANRRFVRAITGR